MLPPLLLCCLLAPALAHAQRAPARPEEEPPLFREGANPPSKNLTEHEARQLAPYRDETPLHDRFTFRVGPSAHFLITNSPGRPFVYPTLGMRRKTPTFYFDLHAPALIAGMDGLSFLIQGLLFPDNATFLFTTLNKPRNYVFVEVLHLRLGKTFRRPAPQGPAEHLDYSFGILLLADWVVFDVALLDGTIPDDASIADLLQRDPAVAGVGGFAAIGTQRNRGSAELALEVGRDLFNWPAYQPATGFVISLDLDTQLQLTRQLAAYLRARFNYYTHIPGKRVFTTTGSTGLSFHF